MIFIDYAVAQECKNPEVRRGKMLAFIGGLVLGAVFGFLTCAILTAAWRGDEE